MKRLSLSRFEAAAQQLVEGSFSRLFGRVLEPLELAHQCLRAAEGWANDHPANYFRVALSPAAFVQIAREAQQLAAQVQHHIHSLARRETLPVADDLLVVIEPDPLIGSRLVEVTASYVARPEQFHTAVMVRQEKAGGGLEELQAIDAFLIVQGRNHVALDRPVTRIGRRFDNDIVLESAAVSRLHAQIRWRDNFFVLYDVSGRGRTLVNGQATREHVLRPGDVIALSDVMLIYGEGADNRGNGHPDQEQASSVTLTKDTPPEAAPQRHHDP
jgi:hypothetical protein